MKFRDAYKQMTDEIHGDKELLEDILDGKKRRKNKNYYYAVSLVAAALVLVAGLRITFGYLNHNTHSQIVLHSEMAKEAQQSEQGHIPLPLLVEENKKSAPVYDSYAEKEAGDDMAYRTNDAIVAYSDGEPAKENANEALTSDESIVTNSAYYNAILGRIFSLFPQLDASLGEMTYQDPLTLSAIGSDSSGFAITLSLQADLAPVMRDASCIVLDGVYVAVEASDSEECKKIIEKIIG